MQLLGMKVRYTEGGNEFVAIVTKVRDEDAGIVNLAVFTDNGCVARLYIAPGDSIGRWRPLEQAITLTDVGEVPDQVTRELVRLNSVVSSLEDLLNKALTQLTELQAEREAAKKLVEDVAAPLQPSGATTPVG